MTEHLDVFLHGDLIGVITPTRRDRRQVTFAIESTYAGAPSMLTEGFSLVPGTKADTRHASNFFGGYTRLPAETTTGTIWGGLGLP